MNCFHFSVSLGYKTTFAIMERVAAVLWIAFIFQYLWDTKQLEVILIMLIYRCELLSFFSIFGIQNNNRQNKCFDCQVVNCFHFSVSLGYKTTEHKNLFGDNELWIAFIFQYLWDTKQQPPWKPLQAPCCELLWLRRIALLSLC